MTRRSRSSLERRMAANKKPHRLGEVAYGLPVSLPDRLRYSRIAGMLPVESQKELESDRAKAAHCPKHGELKDPVIFVVGEGKDKRVAFACPWCSGLEILERWEKEGAS